MRQNSLQIKSKLFAKITKKTAFYTLAGLKIKEIYLKSGDKKGFHERFEHFKNTGSLAKDKNAHETNAHEENTHEINAHEGNKNIQEMKKNQKLMKYSDFKIK